MLDSELPFQNLMNNADNRCRWDFREFSCYVMDAATLVTEERRVVSLAKTLEIPGCSAN